MGEFEEVIAVLVEMLDDDSVPKSVRIELQVALKSLEGCTGDTSLTCDKSLQVIDDLLGDNPGIPSHIRTQLLSVASMLESYTINNRNV